MRVLVLFCLIATTLCAGDWPHFLGPDRNAKSPETGIAHTWPEDGPPLLWQAELGEGFAGAAVKDGKVYILDRKGDSYDVFRVLDLQTGEPMWQFSYKSEGRVPFNGSRGTPTITADAAYAVGMMGDVYAISLNDRSVKWVRNFMHDFGAEAPRFGFAQSPLVHKNLVIVAPMSPNQAMVALHRQSGKVVWQSQAVEGQTYASPTRVTLDGVPQVVLVHSKGSFAVDPRNGNTLWESSEITGSIPDPTQVGTNQLLFTAGYGAGTTLASISRQNNTWQIDPQFKLEDRGSMLHHVIYHDGYFYANFNTNENLQPKKPEGLICFDTSGKTLWKTEKAPAVNRGNLLYIDGHLIALGGEDGVLRLIKATPEAYTEISTAPVFQKLRKRENNIWAPMAIADGKLILRNQDTLQCRDLR